MSNRTGVTTDPWQQLRRLTRARIALGRAGDSLPTAHWLEFRQAHAAARDAVHQRFDAERFIEDLGEIETLLVESRAPDRTTYLQRPDLGRQLTDASRERVSEIAMRGDAPDLVMIVSDGLSALAAHRQGPALASALWDRFTGEGWRLAPIVVVRLGRVAVEDEIGELLNARLSLILIGERPGLGSPDSLGAYLVHAPRLGRTDAERNCVSNIRPEGLSLAAATDALHYLLTQARRRAISGIELKDDRPMALGAGDQQGTLQ